jgi:allene oxide cyclase
MAQKHVDGAKPWHQHGEFTPKRVKIYLPSPAWKARPTERMGHKSPGQQCVREGVMPNRSNLLPYLRLLCIAASGLVVTGAAAVAEPQEIKVVEHASTDAVTDTGAAGDSAGDILTFANEVFDADDKNKVGTDQGICFRTLPGKAWECFWTLSLDKGQITVEGPFLDSGDSVLAITGGTGVLPAPPATWRSALSAPTARPTISYTGSNNERPRLGGLASQRRPYI